MGCDPLWTMPPHFVANGVHSTARGSDSKAAAAAATAMEGYIMPSREEASWGFVFPESSSRQHYCILRGTLCKRGRGEL